MTKSISIIVPTKNEKASVEDLVRRIDKSMRVAGLNYEVIFIDDHSTDGTRPEIQKLIGKYPISLHLKVTEAGKARSLIEGFTRAKHEFIAMIDGDLQYPPEAIAQMFKKLDSDTDIVVARRIDAKTPVVRNTLSKSFNNLFCKKLHNLSCDVQSGLKVFKKEILDSVELNPSPWAFDLEFLIKAKDAGYKIKSHDIDFDKRQNGKSKINLVGATTQIASSAVKLKFRKHQIFQKKQNTGEAFYFKGQKFVSYSKLHPDQTALYNTTRSQQMLIVGLFCTFVVSLLVAPTATIITTAAAISLVYFIDLLFNFFLIYRGFAKEPEITINEQDISNRSAWPVYTILCPLYKEWQVLPQFIKAISQLEYPKNKLQVLLLLEENDTETINKARFSKMPEYFEIVIVPDSKPKTKPKALNYGLKFAKGEYTVVFDAEDIPEPLQLKKAVLAQENSAPDVACVQAKLNFYNPKQNVLTRLFTAEYSLWFDLVLTGLQSVHAPIPLGGTSNHFRTAYLRKLNGWDSFNVTEDCDLGMRITKNNHHTAIINSTTYEEANSDFANWFWQRSRWIKGYMQTYLVHMRTPHAFTRTFKKPHLLIFQLVVGGKVASMLINPIMWAITLAYFMFRSTVGPIVDSYFPAPVLYIAITCLVFGNFLYAYYYMLGSAKRGHFDLVKYVFLIPFYWLAMSAAAYYALYQLIKKPHYWAKTNHGLHLEEKVETLKPSLWPKAVIEGFASIRTTAAKN